MQRRKSERHVFTAEINKIALSSNDDKRMQSIDSIETYTYGTSKDLVNKEEEIKCSIIIKKYKEMINFDDVRKENIKEYNPNWPQILDLSYRILIFGGSGSGKTNSLFNFMNHQQDIDKIYTYDKDLNEAKYQFLIKKREETGVKNFNDSKAFIEYLNDMNDIYKNIEEYNPNKKCKILIVFDDMIADMVSNEKLNPIVTELFIRGRKLNISLVFITQSYFAVPEILD